MYNFVAMYRMYRVNSVCRSRSVAINKKIELKLVNG